MTPRPYQMLASQQPECAPVDPRLRRAGRAGSPLAAGAVTVAGGQRRRGELEAHTTAQAASGQRGIAHRTKCGTQVAGRTIRGRLALTVGISPYLLGLREPAQTRAPTR